MTAPLPPALARMLRNTLAAPNMISDRLLILADAARGMVAVSGSPHPAEAWAALATLAEGLAPAFAEAVQWVPLRPLSDGPMPPPLPDVHPSHLRSLAHEQRIPQIQNWIFASAKAIEAHADAESHAEAIRHG